MRLETLIAFSVLLELAYFSIVHPDFVGLSQDAAKAAIENGMPFDIELQLRTKSQGYRWFRTSAKVHLDMQGKSKRMSGSTQDIHERKLAQTLLEKTNERFLIATESAGIGIWEWDVQNRVLEWGRPDVSVVRTVAKFPRAGTFNTDGQLASSR